MRIPEIEMWIINWFYSKSSIMSTKEIKKRINENFFELGLIDSMNAMELIIDIESNFNISLTHEDFEDDRFFSISGLSQIINEKQQ